MSARTLYGAMQFNPHTGFPRDQRDIDTDPHGKLIVAPGAPLLAAPVAAQGNFSEAYCREVYERLALQVANWAGAQEVEPTQAIVAGRFVRSLLAAFAAPVAPDHIADASKMMVAPDLAGERVDHVMGLINDYAILSIHHSRTFRGSEDNHETGELCGDAWKILKSEIQDLASRPQVSAKEKL